MQDSSVPSHVRDDGHPFGYISKEYPLGYHYEKWAKINFCMLSLFVSRYPSILFADGADEVLSAQNHAGIDAGLRKIWNDTRTAFADNDLGKSLTFISMQSYEHYRELFSAFGDKLPGVAGEMRNIELVYIISNFAKYHMKRTELYGEKTVRLDYNVYFIIDMTANGK